MIESVLNELLPINNLFVITRDIKVTYGEFYENIQRIARDYFSTIKSGDKVAVLIEDKLDFILNFFALIKIGATIVPLDVKSPPEIIKNRLSYVNCKTIVIGYSQYASILKSGYEHINAATYCKCAVEVENIRTIQFVNTQSNIIIFTSGSSGTPKAVFHKIDNFIYSAIGSGGNIQLRCGDNWLLSLPLNHVGGLSILFRVLVSGAALSIAETPGNPQNDISLFKPTHVSLVPTQLYRLLSTESSLKLLKELKAILIGGAGVWSELIENSVLNDLKIYTSYGSTEMCSQVTTTSNFEEDELSTSGKPLEYRELKLSDQGEILVKGKTMFQGYAKADQIISPFDENGYFHTGDRGRLDESGRLCVIGRLDNMFISGGENIFPEEIETALSKLSFIQSAVVVPLEDKEYGSIAVAFIETKYEEIPDKADINCELSQYLPSYKLPKYYLSFPKDYKPLGIKPNRAFLKKQLSD